MIAFPGLCCGRQSLVADRGQAPITQVVQIAPGRLNICSWGIELVLSYLRGLPEIGHVEGAKVAGVAYRFFEGVIVAVAYASDRRLDASLDQPLGIPMDTY